MVHMSHELSIEMTHRMSHWKSKGLNLSMTRRMSHKESYLNIGVTHAMSPNESYRRSEDVGDEGENVLVQGSRIG